MLDLQNDYLNEYEPWEGILAATVFFVQIIYHTILQVIPEQLVFECEIILSTHLIYEWEDIEWRKKELTEKNNQKENNNLKPHNYIVCKKVLIHNKKAKKPGGCV